RVDTFDDTVMDDESNQRRMIDEMDKDDAVVLMDDKEEDKKVEEAKVEEIAQKLEKGNKVRVLKLRRLQRVGTSQRVDTFDDTVMDDESNQGRMIDEMDKDDVVVLMDDKEEDKKVEEAKVKEIAQVQGRQAES
nr:hypothetical protein [Tanacetum cinerariifolium]